MVLWLFSPATLVSSFLPVCYQELTHVNNIHKHTTLGPPPASNRKRKINSAYMVKIIRTCLEDVGKQVLPEQILWQNTVGHRVHGSLLACYYASWDFNNCCKWTDEVAILRRKRNCPRCAIAPTTQGQTGLMPIFSFWKPLCVCFVMMLCQTIKCLFVSYSWHTNNDTS